MPIHAEGQYAPKDIFDGRLEGASRRSLWLYAIAELFALGGSVYLTTKFDGGWRDALVLYAASIYLPSFWIVNFYRAKRQLKQSPNLQGTVQYEFDGDGYRVTAPHSTSDVKWSAIAKWKESERSFVIYPGRGVIPKRFFGSAADVDAVRGLLRAHAKEK